MSQRQQSKTDKDDWQTPARVLAPIQATDPIDMDPCAGEETEIGDINISPPQDGLSYDWEGTVFCNPPYSDKKAWLDKAAQEYQRNTADRVYVLIPDSTDVISWWHEIIAENCRWTVFFNGRVKYIDPDTGEKVGSPPHGSALAIFGDPPDSTLRALSGEGDVVKRPRFL